MSEPLTDAELDHMSALCQAHPLIMCEVKRLVDELRRARAEWDWEYGHEMRQWTRKFDWSKVILPSGPAPGATRVVLEDPQ